MHMQMRRDEALQMGLVFGARARKKKGEVRSKKSVT